MRPRAAGPVATLEDFINAKLAGIRASTPLIESSRQSDAAFLTPPFAAFTAASEHQMRSPSRDIGVCAPCLRISPGDDQHCVADRQNRGANGGSAEGAQALSWEARRLKVRIPQGWNRVPVQFPGATNRRVEGIISPRSGLVVVAPKGHRTRTCRRGF